MVERVNKELIYVFSLIVVILEFGGVFAFGAAFVALLDKYQRDRLTTATVQSILIGVTLSFGVVSGTLITKFGLPLVILISSILVPAGFCSSFFATRIEHLYVSIGVVSGIGISLGYISSVVVIGRIFTGQKRVLYLSIQTAFSSLSGLIYPYIFEFLIDSYGLGGTFLILGAIFCHKIPFGLLCMLNRTALAAEKTTDKTELDSEAANSSGKTKKNTILDSARNFKQMLTITFSVILLATGVSIAGINGFIGLVLDISLWKGFTTSQGLFTFVFFNIANTLSRIVPGFLKQIKGIDSFIYPIFSAVAGLIGQLLFFFGDSYSVYVIGVCLTGICVGGIVSSQLLVLVEIVRPENIPVGSGLLLTVTGIISVSTGPVFGGIRDNFGSYGIVVLTIAALQAIAAILFVVAMIYRRIDAKKKKKFQQKRRNTVFAITVSEL